MAIKRVRDLESPDSTENISTMNNVYNLEPDLSLLSKANAIAMMVKNEVVSEESLSPAMKDELQMLTNMKQTQASIENPLVRNPTGIKNLVTYYNQIPNKSDDLTNRSSPGSTNNTKYTKIKNFILVTDSEITNSVQYDEGIENIHESEATIMPGSIKPYMNDYFYMTMYDKKTLFQITNIEPLAIHAKTGYKIQFEKHHEQYAEDYMDSITTGFFVFNFENMGTGNRTVLKEEVNDIYRAVVRLIGMIGDKYCTTYYDKVTNLLTMEYAPCADEINAKFRYTLQEYGVKPSIIMPIADPYLHKFIERNASIVNLMMNKFPILPTYPLKLEREFDINYNKTIFKSLELRKNTIVYKYQMPLKFSTIREREVIYRELYTVEMVADHGADNVLSLLPQAILNNISMNKLFRIEYCAPSELKYNILVKYITDREYVPTLEELRLLDSLFDEWDYNSYYYLIPIYLYILNKIKDLIEVKSY